MQGALRPQALQISKIYMPEIYAKIYAKKYMPKIYKMYMPEIEMTITSIQFPAVQFSSKLHLKMFKRSLYVLEYNCLHFEQI